MKKQTHSPACPSAGAASSLEPLEPANDERASQFEAPSSGGLAGRLAQ